MLTAPEFNQYIQGLAPELVPQALDQLAMSTGIDIVSDNFDGDFMRSSRFTENYDSAQLYSPSTEGGEAAPEIPISLFEENMVKCYGFSGKFTFAPADFRHKLNMDENEALAYAAQDSAASVFKCALNTILGAGLGAVESNSGVYLDESATSNITQKGFNRMYGQFGDARKRLTSNVIHSDSETDLIDQNIDNDNRLFFFDDVQVLNILGRPTIVTDCPWFTSEAGKIKALGLADGGLKLRYGNDMITSVVERNNGKQIVWDMNANFSIAVGVKGYKYIGPTEPKEADILNSANWVRVYNHDKNTGLVGIAGNPDL